MKKITALHSEKGKQISFLLNGQPVLDLAAELAGKPTIQPAQKAEWPAASEDLKRCLNAAKRYLSYRPRSENELKARLLKGGFNKADIETVLSRMKQQGMVNDSVFARFWTENRSSFRPRSRSLTCAELRQKGINKEIIDEVTAQIDDEESAYRAALRPAQRLPKSDFESFRQRLGNFLRRRGFSYEITNKTIIRIWKELCPKESLQREAQ